MEVVGNPCVAAIFQPAFSPLLGGAEDDGAAAETQEPAANP